MKKKLASCILSLAILVIPQFASAEELWDCGRNYSTVLEGVANNAGHSTVVVSDAANFYNTQGWGTERVRLWSRLDTINTEYYPSNAGYLNTVAQMELNFRVADTQNYSNYYPTDLDIMGTDPATNVTTTTIPGFIFDLLGYFGRIPSTTIKAWVNNVVVSGTSVTEYSGHNKSVNFLAPHDSDVNLPNTIGYSDADGQTSGNYSGADAYFRYTLPSNETNFKVLGEGRVKYYTRDSTGAGWYSWTNWTGVEHTVNSN